MAGINPRCHACRQPISLEDRTCCQCGAPLYIICPLCGRETFLQSNCRYCRRSLYVVCPNTDCKQIQLISPDGRCRNCGEKIGGQCVG